MAKTRKLAGATVLVAAAGLMASLLMASTADAQPGQYYYPSNPCPAYSTQNVLDDPNSDWDGDRLSNINELHFVLNPCVHDATAFCGQQPQVCLNYGNYYYYDYYYDYYLYYYGYYDYYYYYYPYYYDYYYPYTTYATAFTVCQTAAWSWNAVNTYPWQDWDGDGVYNYTEAINGFNPCVYNTYGYVPHVQTPPLPHVGGSGAPGGYTATTCPAGYPYFHPDNGQCYANPVTPTGH